MWHLANSIWDSESAKGITGGRGQGWNKGKTYHVPPQIGFLFLLETPQVIQHAITSVLGVLFRDF